MIISFNLVLPKTFENVSTLSILCELILLEERMEGELIFVACASIMVAMFVAVIGVAISRPDMGNIEVVRAGILLFKGFGPVLKSHLLTPSERRQEHGYLGLCMNCILDRGVDACRGNPKLQPLAAPYGRTPWLLVQL